MKHALPPRLSNALVILKGYILAGVLLALLFALAEMSMPGAFAAEGETLLPQGKWNDFAFVLALFFLTLGVGQAAYRAGLALRRACGSFRSGS
jgi:hypothetical protein